MDGGTVIAIISWAFTLISLIGTVLNSQQKISGFVFWIIGNIGFMTINLLARQYAQATLFFINTLLSINGIINWRKKSQEEQK